MLSQAHYEIHITRDNENSQTYYLLYVDDIVIGFNGDTHVHRSKLPATIRSELVHTMPPQQ